MTGEENTHQPGQDVIPLALPEGEVHLWWAVPGKDDDSGLVAAAGILDEEEMVRLGRLRSAAGRSLFWAARRLLRETLSLYGDRFPAEWRFVRNAYGKPGLAPQTGGKSLAFNLSHTAGLAVLAVTCNAEIGVDVERRDRRVRARQLSDRFFSPRESAALAALPPERMRERFLLHWTLKEACLKAIGRGLSLPLHTVGFDLTGERPFRIRWTGSESAPDAGFRFALVEPLPGYVAALCLAGNGPPPVLRGSLAAAGKAALVILEPIGQSWPIDGPASRP